MLTKEQIKNLKYGDPIVIHTSFVHVDSEGDLFFKAPSFRNIDNTDYISPDYVSLPSVNKYDPCRPFKEGDKVEVASKDGRFPEVLHPWAGDLPRRRDK